MTSTLRAVSQVVQGRKTLEGAGVLVCRTLGTPPLQNLDPFLLLDELRLPEAKASAGFPSHPHRGFETCTIMLMDGLVGPGGVQWTTAGRGIVHSEMPKKSESGRCWGFQLWINLPKKDKMTKPRHIPPPAQQSQRCFIDRYQDYQAKDIPSYNNDGVTVRVIAGASQGTTGPVELLNPGLLLDILMMPNTTFKQNVPAEWNAMAYVCDGEGVLNDHAARVEQAVVFAQGHPIREPIIKHGPFVMNTEKEIQQAYEDFRNGKLQNPDGYV